MSLSAIDSIQHGLLNLRANWQLAVVLFVQTLVVSILSLMGLVPIVLALGFTFLRGVFKSFSADGAAQLLERVFEMGGPLILALLASTLIWTIAFVVYCYFQGGVLGTLAAGEQQALAEGQSWQNYRTYSMSAFSRNAESLTWPIFWLLNIFVLIGLTVVAAFGGVALGLAMVLREGPAAALFVMGCAGLTFLVLVMMFLSVWMQLALARLVTGTRKALVATREALVIMMRRLPGVLLLFLLFIAASMALGIVMMPVSLVLELALRERALVYYAGQAIVSLVQWLASGFMTVIWSSTLIALVMGEGEGKA